MTLNLPRLCLLLSCNLLIYSSSHAATPVIFDTDMAIDDWAALLFLEKHADVKLLAVTVAASGETHCDTGAANALSLLALANPQAEAKVSCGDSWPMDGWFVFPEAWQEDADTLSGVPVPPPARTPYSGHAVELIHASIVSSDQPVVILATGPMTNLAQWLEKYPEDSAWVNRVILMGGALYAPGNIIVPGFTDNHPNKTAEWNFFVDPMAADKVLNSGLSIELVSLDVTNQVRVTKGFARTFKRAANNPAARFWDDVLDKNDWFIESGEYYFWDVLAAITLIDRDSFCKGERLAIGAYYETTDQPYAASTDLSMPDTRWDGARREHFDAATAGIVTEVSGDGSVLVCESTNGPKALDMFITTMTARK